MKTVNFPYLAAGLGVIFLLIVMLGSATDVDGNTSLPLLTLLIINEFAFFLTAAGCFIGIKQIHAAGFNAFYFLTTLLCILLTVEFILLGFKLWPL